jgi:hypothetical protein
MVVFIHSGRATSLLSFNLIASQNQNHDDKLGIASFLKYNTRCYTLLIMCSSRYPSIRMLAISDVLLNRRDEMWCDKLRPPRTPHGRSTGNSRTFHINTILFSYRYSGYFINQIKVLQTNQNDKSTNSFNPKPATSNHTDSTFQPPP